MEDSKMTGYSPRSSLRRLLRHVAHLPTKQAIPAARSPGRSLSVLCCCALVLLLWCFASATPAQEHRPTDETKTPALATTAPASNETEVLVTDPRSIDNT